ncbi:DUF1638 domain-containing protein [Solidesulfovibrio sp.]
MLHMRPERLGEALLALAGTEKNRPLLLVYGDCCPQMGALTQQPQVRKVRGVNCCDILLGPDVYRRLRREGVFFFLPEWTARWEEIFRIELGLKEPALAREFMHEMHQRLLYLDTGLAEPPRETLAEIGAFFDMPVEIHPVGLKRLRKEIFSGLQNVAQYD